MKRFMFMLVGIAVYVFGGLDTCLCQEPHLPEYDLPRVGVTVSAHDDFRGQIESYMSRELRSLGDVTVVDSKADKVDELISIVALKLSDLGGYDVGYALSVVVLSPFDTSFVIIPIYSMERNLEDVWLNNDWNKQQLEWTKRGLKDMTTGLYRYSNHWLVTCATDGLKLACEIIVADFDNQCLEPYRKSYREMIGRMKTIKEQRERE